MHTSYPLGHRFSNHTSHQHNPVNLFLQVTKNRFDGQLGGMALRFDKESLSFSAESQQPKELNLDEVSTASQQVIGSVLDELSNNNSHW